MSTTPLQARVRSADDGVAVIGLTGDVTAACETELMDAYREASRSEVRGIVLDFSGLDYMNSSGIGLLVTLLIRVNRQKQRLLTYGLSEHYRRIFTLTRLNEAIGIYATEAEALAAA